MKISTKDYSLFHKFIDAYMPQGFYNIDRSDPLILQLEEMTEANKQYFFIADLLQGQIIFASKQSLNIIGLEPDGLNPYHHIEVIHPEELYRNTKGWAKLLNMANDLYTARKGFSILSVNMKMRNPQGIFNEILYQCYSFYSDAPRKTVYVLIALTNIESFKMRKNGYHYYTGNDMSYFRYPDEKLLRTGNNFTRREYEIIRLIDAGLNTEQIAKELFLSKYTVSTHRGNILKKTNKTNITDLISELKERGMI